MTHHNPTQVNTAVPAAKAVFAKTMMLIGLSTFLSGPTHSGNAIYTTGYGAISGALSGADIAVETDVTAVVTNPATLGFINTSRGDLYLSPLIFMPMNTVTNLETTQT